MPIKHHEDCDVYQATLASEGPYGDPTITPSDYSCLSDCEENSEDTTLERRLIVNTESVLDPHYVIVEIEPDVWVYESGEWPEYCYAEDPYSGEIAMLLELA